MWDKMRSPWASGGRGATVLRWAATLGAALGVASGVSATVDAKTDTDAPAWKRGRWIAQKKTDKVTLPGVLYYPPREASSHVLQSRVATPRVAPKLSSVAARDTAVMLHGMCHEPIYECPHFASSFQDRGFLICPRANLECPGGAPIWSWKKRHITVEQGIGRVAQLHPGDVEERGRLLMGFSLGGFAAVDVIHRGSTRYDRVLILGARVYPYAKLFKKAGVKKVLLAAGDYDMVVGHMRHQAKLLKRRGVDARFMSLGKVGHAFPPHFEQWLKEALDWLDAPSTHKPRDDEAGPVAPSASGDS